MKFATKVANSVVSHGHKHKAKRTAHAVLFALVKAAGIEPASENPFLKLSPSAANCLKFLVYDDN